MSSEKGAHSETSPPGKGPGHLCSEGLRFHTHRNHLKLSRESAIAPMTGHNTSQNIVPCERKYGHSISKSPLQSRPNLPPKPLCLSKMGLMCASMCPRGPGTSTLETWTLRQREAHGGQVWGTEQAPSRAVPLSVAPRWGSMGPMFLRPSHSCLDVTTQHGQPS